MKRFIPALGLTALVALPAWSMPTGASRKGNSSSAPIDYVRDVKPILVAKCYACHGNGAKLGEFQIDSREGILTGGATHPVVRPGNSRGSYLIKLVSGQVPGKIMPARGKRLTSAEVGLLKAWIDQGLKFDAAGSQAVWKAPLEPRHPAVPAPRPGSGLTNPIDLLLQPYFAAHPASTQIASAGSVPVSRAFPATIVDDRTYARRVYLDVIGLLPSLQELQEFLADRKPDKRARLAEKLLNDNQRYGEHWLTFWNDMLRNDYAGTGYIDGGRTQITGWLYRALINNLPYDQFVSQLVNPSPESAGFSNGIVWRGVVNASQTPQMQAAQSISQVFMGVNLKCASCHNSFINNWKLADAYGMAGIYADQPLQMVRCDKPTGQAAPIKFLYPQLGQIDGSAPRSERLAQLAKIITSKQDGRLARTLVNRLWTKVMGRGLVEPNDDMDARPWAPDLLDWLASDFADNGYDVKKTLLRIVTSRAYQLPSMALRSEQSSGFVFSGPAVKRMSAEQLLDSISELTGVWSKPASQFQIAKGKPILPAIGNPKIKSQSGLMKSGSVDIDVDISGSQVLFLVVTDAGNGANFDWADWVEPKLIGPKGEIKLTDISWRSASTGYGNVQINKNVEEKPLRLGTETFQNGIGTHANSAISYLLPEGYARFRCKAGPDTGGIESEGSETSIELYVITGDRALLETRAAMANNDPLMRALGRPNREQVVTQRQTAATTLQALELTNGGELAGILSKGAETWMKECGGDASRVVNTLYERALCRPPTPAERETAIQIIGAPASKEGVEDLLWSVIMLPEVQLIY